jgi:hypothetical protein
MMRAYGRKLLLVGLLVVVIGVVACSRATPPPAPVPPTAQQLQPPAQPQGQQPTGDWVVLTFPPAERLVPNPVVIEGNAAPSVQTARIQVREPNQDILLGEQIVNFSGTSSAPRGFSVQIFYPSPPSPIYGVIQVYANGSAEPATEVRVGLSAAATSEGQ